VRVLGRLCSDIQMWHQFCGMARFSEPVWSLKTYYYSTFPVIHRPQKLVTWYHKEQEHTDIRGGLQKSRLHVWWGCDSRLFSGLFTSHCDAIFVHVTIWSDRSK
jgi:hypothetical protein